MLVFYLLSGIVGVSNMILWGLYGDLLVEPFELRKILRSLGLALFYAFFLYLINDSLPLFIVALSVIAFERVTTEVYKAFIRIESQIKYKIPSDLNIKAPSDLKKLFGFAVLLIFLAVYYEIDLQANNLLLMILVGVIAALGGAFKDAPYEGFDKLKFWRSPVVSFVVGLLIYFAFPGLESKFFLMAVPGGERIVSEFYKKIYRSKIPGKFKESLPPNKAWQKARHKLLWVYALNITALAVLFLYSLDQAN